MLYIFGKQSFKAWEPNHTSSQNLTWEPSPNLNLPSLKNSVFDLHKACQNCESPSIESTWVIVLSLKYFLLSKLCHKLSSLINLNNNLLRRHLLWTSKFKTSSPPWSFGVQTTLHFANLYFFCAPHSAKKSGSIKIQPLKDLSWNLKERKHKYRLTVEDWIKKN